MTHKNRPGYFAMIRRAWQQRRAKIKAQKQNNGKRKS